ncbi:protein serine/threonine phosphatase 2C [Meredithblackwellia eburnea MCA 4105]
MPPRLGTPSGAFVLARHSCQRNSATRKYSATQPPPPHPVPVANRRAVDLGLIGAGGLALSALVYWASSRNGKSDKMGSEDDRPAFTIPYESQGGASTTKTLTLLSQHETNQRLTEHQQSFSVGRRSNPVIRYDTNFLNSNSPIEDDSCVVVLERDPQSKVAGDLMFWGIFDGHSGWQTSRLLSSSLVSYVARELDLVYRAAQPYSSHPLVPSNTSSASFWSLFSSSSAKSPELDLVDPIVQAAIKNGFDKMDEEIVQTPVRLLEKLQKEGKISKPSREGSMSVEQMEALTALLPALSGSCALLAFLDAARNKLHVACTGDSRAVMGIWEPGPKGKGGKWKAEALSEDQTGREPKEVARMKAEHPPNEADTVITRGRVLGNLEPTRAFGDARYKWPIGMQERLAEAFHPGQVRGRPRNYLTPPYVKSTPEVKTIDLTKGTSSSRKSLASFLPVASSADPASPATRFIVLATDGLYDRLENEEVVALVGAHLSGLRGPQSRQSVLSHVSPSTPDQSGSTHTHAPRQEPTRGEGDVYVFEDGNLGTHLIRNALGGAKREQVSALLSIPSPLSRRYRDDITVTVILLGEGQGTEGGTGGVYRREDIPLKAKL